MSLASLERYLTLAERAELAALLAADKAQALWRPLPGPQTLAWYSDADVIGMGGAAGGGKGLAIDTPIATPSGWRAIGDLQPGDLVFSATGEPCAVTAVMRPALRKCFRLAFDDGSELVADDVHRWVTFDAAELSALSKRTDEYRARRRASRSSRTKPTTTPAQLAVLLARNAVQRPPSLPAPIGTLRDTHQLHATLRTPRGRANHAIPVAGALMLPDADVAVPPYTLGAWLGDGSSRNGQLTGEDPEIWQRIEHEGFEVRHYKWNRLAHNIIGLVPKLRAAGLLRNKHIPPAYMRASYDQRLALLQGLMDTDGHAALDGGCEFDGVNERLVRDVHHLVCTLGLKATLQIGTARLNGRAIGQKWRVKFTTALPVFSLTRKAERLRKTQRRTTRFRYLTLCEPTASTPTVCIAVDSPNRQYLAGRSLIPTHNTDLAAGMILNAERALFVRREKAQTEGLVQRLSELLAGSDGLNSQKGIWRLPTGALLELGGLDNPGDETRWQGRPHDLKCFDEVVEMREDQVRFIMGWRRTASVGRKARILMTFNPPRKPEGRWVVQFFGPWLDRKHPRPAKPGELRWFTTIGGKDQEVPDARAFVLVEGQRVCEFDEAEHRPEDIIRPLSRTFIPARITDNPYYMASGYMSTLQALPDVLRDQMLYGDMEAGVEDSAWQVIPTAWVEAAMARWKPRAPRGEMLAMGVDVARGGKDQTVIATRHKADESAHWYAPLYTYPGAETPDGPTVAGLVVSVRRDDAPVLVDVIGVGASPYDHLRGMGLQVLGVNFAERDLGADRSGRLRFANTRSAMWWRMREALDPANDTGIALPPDQELLAELCMPTWRPTGWVVQVESREDIVKRLGRSPDRATAVILALPDLPKVRVMQAAGARQSVLDYDPFAGVR